MMNGRKLSQLHICCKTDIWDQNQGFDLLPPAPLIQLLAKVLSKKVKTGNNLVDDEGFLVN